MLILTIIIIGMAAGWLAQLILGRGGDNSNRDWAEALVAGLVGSFVGGALGSLIAGEGFKIKSSGLIGTVVGAVIVLAVWGAIRRKK